MLDAFCLLPGSLDGFSMVHNAILAVPARGILRLLLLHFDGAGRCRVLCGGGMSGCGVMLGLCGFLPLVHSSLAFCFVLENLLVFFLWCFVAHSRESKVDTVINKWQ